MSTVSVIIPALNEAENLKHVLPLIPGDVAEVILVDGNSRDDTVAVAQQILPSIRVITQEGKGKGCALRTGFAAAKGDIIVMLDADGSTDPREIPQFVAALERGADFAKGSRFLPGGGTSDMTLVRKLGNWGFVAIVRLMFGGKYTDLCYGYNAFRTGVLPYLQLNATGFEIETMMNLRALWAGIDVVEVPSFEYSRIHGQSNLRTIPDGWRVLKQIAAERFRSPVRRNAYAGPARNWAIPAVAENAGASVAVFADTTDALRLTSRGATDETPKVDKWDTDDEAMELWATDVFAAEEAGAA